MDVKAPNGDVYDLPDTVASGLVGSPESGWSRVEKASDQQGKPARSSKK